MRIELRPHTIKQPGSDEATLIEVFEPIATTPIGASGLSSSVHDALIDSGSTASYFFTSTPLSSTPYTLGGVGDTKISAYGTKATLRLQSDGETFSWEANILLTNHQTRAVLGYVGFFEFFTVKIDSESKILEITPNAYFIGTKKKLF